MKRGPELIDELKNLTGLRTNKEFFDNAITLFDWAVLQAMLGRSLVSLDEFFHLQRARDGGLCSLSQEPYGVGIYSRGRAAGTIVGGLGGAGFPGLRIAGTLTGLSR
jgi:hypothetical protein